MGAINNLSPANISTKAATSQRGHEYRAIAETMRSELHSKAKMALTTALRKKLK